MDEKKNCDECGLHDRIMYKCKYSKQDWCFLCQGCLLEMRSKYGDDFEFDQTWKTF